MTQEQILIEQYLLTENRIEFLKKTFKDKISTEHDQLATKKDSDSIIDHFAEHDPSEKKEYTQWMVGQYRKGNVRQEDAHSMGETVGLFHNNKQNLEQKDINTFKHIADLRNATEQFKEKKEEFVDPKEAAEGTEKIYEAPGIKAFKIKNAEASRAMGAGTSWCTNQKTYYDNYTKGKDPTFVVMTKEGNKFQIHHSTNQFKDEQDVEVKSDNQIYQKYRDHFTKIIDKSHSGKKDETDLVSRFGTVTDEAVDNLLKQSKYDMSRSKIYKNASLSKAHIDRMISKRPEAFEIASFGSNPNITEREIRDHYEKFNSLSSDATKIDGSLINNQNTPEDIVQKVYAEKKLIGSSNVHKLSKDQLTQHISDFNRYESLERDSLEKHPNLNEVLHHGSKDFHEEYSKVATNPETISKYANGEIKVSHESILSNAKLKPKHIESLYFNNHQEIMKKYDSQGSLLNNPNTPSSVLIHAIDNHNVNRAFSTHAIKREEIKNHVILNPKRAEIVVKQMLENRKFNQEEKHKLLDAGYHQVLKHGDEEDTPELINKAVKVSNGNVITHPDKDKHLNDESLQIIAKSNPHRLMGNIKAGGFKNISSNVIKNIPIEHKEIVRDAIKRTKESDALQHVYDNGNHLDKQKVLMHPNAPETLLQKHVNDPTMHGAISANPKIPHYIARAIAEGPILDHVKDNLKNNKNVPADVKEMLK